MKVVFRTDSSIDIGIGHVMRCLTLADALKKKNIEIVFIARNHVGNINKHIRDKGYFVHLLPTPNFNDNHEDFYLKCLGVSLDSDAEQSKKIIDSINPDLLVIDHYAINSQWERQVSLGCKYIMVIDDLANRTHFCDILLDQTLNRTSKVYKEIVPANCKIFVGSRFALLRPEFSKLRSYSKSHRKFDKLRHLLVFMGGIDRDNVTELVLESLTDSKLGSECEITVVMGSRAPFKARITQLVQKLPFASQVIIDASNMAELMARSDFSIGAAGSTSWERCCLGLPSVLVTVADNQKEIAFMLKSIGAVYHLEHPLSKYFVGNLRDIINEIAENSLALNLMSSSAFEVTSGKGADIVSEYIMDLISS